jgi:hypothetical protein
MKEACRGAKMVATREREVTREQFQELVGGGVIWIPRDLDDPSPWGPRRGRIGGQGLERGRREAGEGQTEINWRRKRSAPELPPQEWSAPACASMERVCAHSDSGCWRWVYDKAQKTTYRPKGRPTGSIHHLNTDVICVDCCADRPWTEGCQCDAISRATDLSKCGENYLIN